MNTQEQISNLRGLITQKSDAINALLNGRDPDNLQGSEAEKLTHLLSELQVLDVRISNLQMQSTSGPIDFGFEGGYRSSRGPFKRFGEFLQAVYAVGTGGRIDSRLTRAATGAGETALDTGGFLVQTDFATELIRRTYQLAVIAPKCRKIPISGPANSIKINAVAETSRVTGSRWGGIQAYWAAEAGTKTPAAPKFRQMELSLKKLVGLCYSTDELLADASALESVIGQAFAEEFAFMLDDAIINGTGVGQPLGIMKSNAIVKATRAGAGAIVNTDIGNMYARQWARSMLNSVWFCNQDTLPQFFAMQMTVGTGGMPVYLPPGGLSQSPYSTLMGRPLIPIEQCQTMGTSGDLILADMGEYLLIDKGGMTSASSIHVRFANDETAFRSDKRAAYVSDDIMNSSLIRGSLNSKEHGNPEPSRGFMPWACVETIQEPAYLS
jgi:HK97 family phage major capsid protein